MPAPPVETIVTVSFRFPTKRAGASPDRVTVMLPMRKSMVPTLALRVAQAKGRRFASAATTVTVVASAISAEECEKISSIRS